MYVKNDGHTYYDGGDQRRSRGAFLLLLQRDDDLARRPTLYAIIRKVALRQFGHWMMGYANVNGNWIVVSGAYGHDGLPITVGPGQKIDRLPADAVEVPAPLARKFWEGGGWNDAGSEAESMRRWANG